MLQILNNQVVPPTHIAQLSLPNAAANNPLSLDLRALDQLQHHRPAGGSVI